MNYSTILLLCEKLKHLKQAVIKWKLKKKQKMKVDMVHVEEQIAALFDNNLSHIFDADDLNTLQDLKRKKNEILSHEEATWRL
jgi:hypothetical protein